ncbi:class II fumarate hydratase [Sulfitobacter sp. HI0054]|nr:class II fumarate hydratase [Sulfitobacter sp. HI0023]KZY25968.1 class II fumarate hydratase [Sulfitobacter sp. HI0040]KZY50302.1 class II fumarate hydratase [Sulfitobacter sp. HI0054]KZZ66559.1 class II fumarate hydratase [Sulfitobacter sp. HI0129]
MICSERMRNEADSVGVMAIPADRYWGAQTQRALAVFTIEGPQMPVGVIRAFALQKGAAAEANLALGMLPDEIATLIGRAAEEMREGRFDNHFPLPIWQTGSGTQTNMNANEVLANRANEMAGQGLGTRTPVHPNDHVNRSQSSNDSFPTVMQIAAVEAITGRLLPALSRFQQTLEEKAQSYHDLVRLGRTHLNDAVPVTLGQNFASYGLQIARAKLRVSATLPDLHRLPQGGTAAGSGLNAPHRFAQEFCNVLSRRSGADFTPSSVAGEGMAAHDAVVAASAACEGVAVSLIHILNDIRLLASGPRAGLGELELPDDGLSSSIMPGKRNATLAEALLQVCHRALGNHTTVVAAGASGLFELNVAKPVLIHALLESVSALADGLDAFRSGCLIGLKPNRARMARNVEMSLMVATALTPRLGYDAVARLTRKAEASETSLRETCLAVGLLSADEYDRLIDPVLMAKGGLMGHPK